MFEFLLTDDQKALRDECRDLVNWVPRQMVLDLDQDLFEPEKCSVKPA